MEMMMPDSILYDLYSQEVTIKGTLILHIVAKSLAVQFRDFTTYLSLDDKCKIDVGESGFIV